MPGKNKIIIAFSLLFLLALIFLLYRNFIQESRFRNASIAIDACLIESNFQYADLYRKTCQSVQGFPVCRLKSIQEEGLSKIRDEWVDRCLIDF